MIELVNQDNLGDFLVLAKRMHAESAYRHLPFNGQKLSQYVGNPIIFAALAKRDNAYVGVMMGIVSPDIFGDAPIATDFGLYVEGKARGGFAAIALVRAFERWAKEKGAVEIRPGVTAHITDEHSIALYKRLGYEVFGTLLRKNIKETKPCAVAAAAGS